MDTGMRDAYVRRGLYAEALTENQRLKARIAELENIVNQQADRIRNAERLLDAAESRVRKANERADAAVARGRELEGQFFCQDCHEEPGALMTCTLCKRGPFCGDCWGKHDCAGHDAAEDGNGET